MTHDRFFITCGFLCESVLVSVNDKDCELRKLTNGSEVNTFLFTLQPVLLEYPHQVVRIRLPTPPMPRVDCLGGVHRDRVQSSKLC